MSALTSWRKATLASALALALSVPWVAHAAQVTGPAPVSKSGPKHKRGGSKTDVAGVVNLNQATAAQLDMLPGVGAKAAQAIVAYRVQHPFSRPEELVKVKGFGKKRFDKLKAHLAISGPTTLKQVPKAKA